MVGLSLDLHIESMILNYADANCHYSDLRNIQVHKEMHLDLTKLYKAYLEK